MRSVHHSSAFDGVREAAMRTGTSGSGMGRGRTLLVRRRPFHISSDALLLLGFVLVLAVIVAWPR